MLELVTGFAGDTEWVLFTAEFKKKIILNLVYLLSDFVIMFVICFLLTW